MRVWIEQRGTGELSWVVLVGDTVAVSGLAKTDAIRELWRLWWARPEQCGNGSPTAENRRTTRGAGLPGWPLLTSRRVVRADHGRHPVGRSARYLRHRTSSRDRPYKNGGRLPLARAASTQTQFARGALWQAVVLP